MADEKVADLGLKTTLFADIGGFSVGGLPPLLHTHPGWVQKECILFSTPSVAHSGGIGALPKEQR